MDDKKKKELDIILKKMCEIAGVNFDEVDWKNENDPYYKKYSWAEQQEKEFIEWLKNRLETNKITRQTIMKTPVKNKEIMKRATYMFNFTYGFKTKTK